LEGHNIYILALLSCSGLGGDHYWGEKYGSAEGIISYCQDQTEGNGEGLAKIQ
jgi:hypothetical protein